MGVERCQAAGLQVGGAVERGVIGAEGRLGQDGGGLQGGAAALLGQDGGDILQLWPERGRSSAGTIERLGQG